ncbi:neurofibromin 1 [Apiospora kogelbergensis]|uniref:neurofibromin 1 n=1 Tax=Apiospora kogelbergensis TaxID=1337665 RepID=UPI00312DB31E
MNGDAGLVGCLVERLTTRLPHRTGTQAQDLRQDEIAVITRQTLIKISSSSVAVVLDSLVTLLEELGRPYKSFVSHPTHILLSELYVLALAADCCRANWKKQQDGGEAEIDAAFQDGRPSSIAINLQRLDNALVTRILDHFKHMLEPLPDGFALPTRSILDEETAKEVLDPRYGEPVSRGASSSSSDEHVEGHGASILQPHDVEPHVRSICEFLTASSWPAAFDYFRTVIYTVRAAVPVQAGAPQPPTLAEDEKFSLVILRLLSYAWLDSQKLGQVIQELCSSFLHFRKSFQSTIAIVTPLMIIRWLDRYPEEFVRLHNQRRRLDGGADTLFDMTQTITDSTRRRTMLQPLQMMLLFLVPEVFEVASNLREAKSGSMSKKVQFLDNLRKQLRNQNETAGYCLVCLLRAARHFDDDSDAAFVSFAMDVQDEVRDAVFRRYSPSLDGSGFDQDLITAALISLTHLNFDGSIESLVQACLHASAPQVFKIALIQACSYFARQRQADQYRPLFHEVAGFIQEQMKTMLAASTNMYLGDHTSQRKASETSASNTAMICTILKFLDASPTTLFENAPVDSTDKFYEDNFEAFISCLVSANDQVRSLSSAMAHRLLAPDGILASLRKAKRLETQGFKIKFWKLTSLSLMSMCVKYMQQGDSTVLQSIHGYLESRLLLLTNIKELSEVLDEIPERTALTAKLETLFLVSLNSADIDTCQLVTSCIGLFNDECRIVDSTLENTKATVPLLRNSDVFSEIASRAFRFTGVVAFQKRLLACSNVRVRESMREVLSVEISPNLYQPLFKALESELEVLFTGALETAGKSQDGEIIFAEQTSSLLKVLVERLETPSDLGAAASVHLGSLTLSFAKFLDSAPDNIGCLRVKIKVCQLCEVVTRKKEHLNLRDDVRIRNQLLEIIFGWIARPRSPREGGYGGLRQDEITRIQRDLDRACLRSLAELTFRLPLQPGDGQNDAGTSELKSQMFHTYFNRFLSLLNYEPMDMHRSDMLIPSTNRDESTSSGDLAITILSNLLSANIDVGLKHSLSIGYHENVEIRTAFVKVLYNILVQGTEFSNLSDAAVSERYEELLDILTHDLHLAVAISTVCPSSEVDELTISLLNIFETRGLTFELMEALIKQEIEETENESEILRRNCVATKILSVYAKWKGAEYLRATLQKVVERLMLTSKDLDLELDPARIHSQEEVQKNALQLRIVAKVFIDDIRASSATIPASFRKICSIISAAVMTRFPEAKYTAVGAFIFLRFFCPAIVAPEAEGLVSVAPSKEMRRGLLLIAKVIQNLANNVLFGAKEPYMYPLNDFLAQNIYRVTQFLREISIPPDADTLDTPSPETETFDFGSCVALHRFLYDHWDQVRQKLMTQTRRDYVRSPNELARGRSPAIEPLRNLVTTLGPPPLAVTWNRPQISSNAPLAYSRFQHFMLRNAFRSTESFMTSRAVYDGGESKDGLSIICVILRHIDSDSIDFDTLIYCYLKIASRLWHRPFGLLIDATCYNGQNEPQDDLFKKLEFLSPTEISRSLSRIYVYNMNSAFRKCLRRILRLATKNEASIFNPGNVEYHLIGSLQDLQSHFHLSQLHLPKETISVVTDTRYVFQSITRLSKTRGQIEVIIKVGSQFVQVTTTKKQEVHPGFRLHATVNDIFRLGEVEEAPTSIPTDDDSAFGLRADNGKIVMYFQSSKKSEVLQAVRGAKAKYGKDTRTLKSYERLIRPQDVPGTLLNLALTNLAAADPILRLSSYNLLGALCRAFKFKAASKFMCIRDIAVPLDPTQFIVNISKHLAQEEPQLTSDFLNEFFVGWESFSDEQKPLSLAYMAPWLPSLRTSLLGDEADSEKGKERIAVIFRKLIDVTITDPTLNLTLEHSVWPNIYKDETLLDIFLEEVLKAALALGMHDEQTQCLTSIITAMGTITLRGKIISRLRKALNRSSQRPTKYMPDNAVWPEICTLLQFCLSLSFDCGVQSQLYLPEIFHVVTMLANTGPSDVRILVHRLLINSIHAACTSFNLEEAKLSKLRGALDTLSEPRNDIFSPPVFTRDGASISTNQDNGQTLGGTESLAALLFEICSTAAPSVDMANAWRSRWMSLVASTAFQNNPAVQPRAFTVMGCLAREEVDDDLLYQVLVALRSAVGRFGEDNNEMLIAIGRAQLEDAALPLDDLYGIHFTVENFHFAVGACLIRGLTDTMTKGTALRVLSTLMEIGNPTTGRPEQVPLDMLASPYFALVQSRTVGSEELKETLWQSGINPMTVMTMSQVRTNPALSMVKDKDMLLNTAIALVDFQYLQDSVQHRTLLWLNELATMRPTVVAHLSFPIVQILDDILLHCQNSTTLEAAHTLLQAMTSDHNISAAMETSGVLNEILEEVGFGGLWRSCSFSQGQEPDKQCFALTEKLIEVSLNIRGAILYATA